MSQRFALKTKTNKINTFLKLLLAYLIKVITTMKTLCHACQGYRTGHVYHDAMTGLRYGRSCSVEADIAQKKLSVSNDLTATSYVTHDICVCFVSAVKCITVFNMVIWVWHSAWSSLMGRHNEYWHGFGRHWRRNSDFLCNISDEYLSRLKTVAVDFTSSW